MKKSILLGIVALAAAAATSYGQGYIALDNYASGLNPAVTYGANVPANGVSGALGSGGLNSTWTAGFYWVTGTTGLSEAAGNGIPSATLALAAGTGSTVQFDNATVFNTPGFYSSTPSWYAGSITATTITLEIVVYDTAGGSYANAAYRGHSAAFSMSTGTATQGVEPSVGDHMPGTIVVTSVTPVPEPTTLALGGLGLAALMLVRRKKA